MMSIWRSSNLDTIYCGYTLNALPIDSRGAKDLNSNNPNVT